MSFYIFLAADKPVPRYVSDKCYTYTNGPVSMTKEFAVTKWDGTRYEIEKLGMKPCQMELYWEDRSPEELEELRRYLRENFSPGEEVEIWGVWLGDDEQRALHFRSTFAEFGMETVEILRKGGSRLKEGVVIPKGKPIPGSACVAEQVCITIEM